MNDECSLINYWF